jgi:predicted N-formylglutamate amidohydrolase
VSLLSPREPGPFELIECPGDAPYVFVCDHASNRIPRTLGNLGVAPHFLLEHIAWDVGASAVARRLCARFRAGAVLANYSRLVIDLNRGLTDPSAIPEISDGVPIPGNTGLDEAQIGQRVDALYAPYHAEIDALIERRTGDERTPVFVGVHSFTPRFQGFERPWHIGILWDVDPRLPLPLIAELEKVPGIVVGNNEPYSGRHPADYSIDHHAEPRGLAHAGIEIRQDLIEDEEGQDYWADLLGNALETVFTVPELYRVREDLTEGMEEESE